eukprot:5889406-Alexandrium_andersonii.AAC.1
MCIRDRPKAEAKAKPKAKGKARDKSFARGGGNDGSGRAEAAMPTFEGVPVLDVCGAVADERQPPPLGR